MTGDRREPRGLRGQDDPAEHLAGVHPAVCLGRAAQRKDVVHHGAQLAPGVTRVANGISGDARRSSVELGKRAFDIKVDYAVKQIRGFLGQQ